jgi:hypothetical protein
LAAAMGFLLEFGSPVITGQTRRFAGRDYVSAESRGEFVAILPFFQP